MAELSVIVPYINEEPQILFTLRALAEELRDIDFEVLAVDNTCRDLEVRGIVPDSGREKVDAAAFGNPWLKSLGYSARASHWQAKNLAVSQASGDVLMFVDGHVVPGRGSISSMFKFYRQNWEELNGTLHLPLTYKILEWRKLIYRLDVDLSVGKLHYTFDTYVESEKPYRVPCMSSCGMMMHRKIFELLGGWPTGLGSWGGGENFLNFALAVLGKNVWIWPGEPLYHHGEKRGYSMWRKDILFNRVLALYVVCGYEFARRFIVHCNAPGYSLSLRERMLSKAARSGRRHHELIRERQVMEIEQWLREW